MAALIFGLALVCLLRPQRASGELHSSAEKLGAKPWWAYRPIERPTLPAVKNTGWLSNPIDAFILEKLERAGLTPAPPADRIALIRRATYDLVGLPPEPDHVAQFVTDPAADSFEKVIDRLLASPQYGEKWGRHWLDLVRYAETNGYERDGTKPFAWRYRDYVIQSFNEDKPYDQFVREQLAGDEIVPARADAITATGFYRLGIWDDEPADPLLARYDELDDILTTASQVFLGTTVNCARCHDHKADPIPQSDYYRLIAFFQDIPRYGNRSTSEQHVLTDISNLTYSREQNRRRTELTAERDGVQQRAVELEQAGILKMPAEDQRATEGPQRAKVLKEKLARFLTDEQRQQYDSLKKQLATLQSELDRSRDLVLSVNNCSVSPVETHVLARGSPHAPGKLVQPGFPSAVSSADPVIPPPGPSARASGRRSALAAWITSHSNPLTARVMANRLWHHHFGRGIVRTTNDFGKLGELPTHPELLDWLALELMSRGWSLKQMHKLIMLSKAYQMSSQDNPRGFEIDPGNDLFWRFDMRRLTAEEVRDSILAVNGSLNPRMGGPSIYTQVPTAVLQTASRPDAAWGNSPAHEQARRSVYVFVKRSLIEPILGTFDLPDPDSSCAVRFATTVPTQSLTSLNSDFFNHQAAVLARRLRDQAGDSIPNQIRLGLNLILARQPTNDEVSRCIHLYNDLQAQDGLDATAAMNTVCLLMLNLNEFVYLD